MTKVPPAFHGISRLISVPVTGIERPHAKGREALDM